LDISDTKNESTINEAYSLDALSIIPLTIPKPYENEPLTSSVIGRVRL
jgi:hypothetical protein